VIDLAAHALEVAPRLLGARLSVNGVTIRLTEVEAYGGEGEDPGAHSFRGMTRRNATMFGPPGHIYVYFTYGMHWCANVVCSPEGESSTVLLRAGELVDGLELARARRMKARSDAELARGPARLTTVLSLTGADDGRPLDLLVDPLAEEAALSGGDERRLDKRSASPRSATAATRAESRSPVRLELPAAPARTFAVGPRTGVSGPGGDARAYPWRFWLPGEASVSPYRPHQPKRRRTGPVASEA